MAEEPAAPLPKFTDKPGAIPCNAISAFAVGILDSLSPDTDVTEPETSDFSVYHNQLQPPHPMSWYLLLIQFL